ncbi:THAP domain-containing protein 5 isoform X2 [Ascaphus truei]
MKQSKWHPSKHQVLCSDHFTQDSFNIRWGIRYLKPSAVPTIFSMMQDPYRSHLNENSVADTWEVVEMKQSSSGSIDSYLPISNSSNESDGSDFRPFYLKSLTDGVTIAADESKELHCQQTKQVYKMSSFQIMDSESYHTSLENIFNSTIADLDSKHYEMCFEHDQADDILTENSITFDSHFRGIQQSDEESLVLNTITQTIGQLDAYEESVITIIVPGGISEKQPMLTSSLISDEQQFTNLENLELKDFCKDSDSGNEMLQTEHSYCRQHFDRDHLWEKIAKLHYKITHLEIQEKATLSRLESLEAIIRHLKQKNLLSEEKLRIVESCYNSFDVTMVQ